jgi:uncharacterized protein
MGWGAAPPSFRDIVWLMQQRRLAIFPLGGAILFPGLHLPLHIFEPRYRAMVGEALVRDRMIGMVQPRADGNASPQNGPQSGPPPIYDMGCVGRIVEVEAMDDGRYNILLQGTARFRVLQELSVTTPFRQVEAAVEDVDGDAGVLSAVERAAVEQEARRFCDAQGYTVDWGSITGLDDETFINGIAQVAPFDNASKQALLEADNLNVRADLAIELMRFFGKRRPDDGPQVTLQ